MNGCKKIVSTIYLHKAFPFSLKLSLGFILASFFVAQAQQSNTPSANKNKFYISSGAAFSTVDLDREVHNISRGGIDVRAGLYFSNDLRLIAEAAYCSYAINPTWLNVHSSNYEINLNYIGEIEDSRIYLYALSGINFQCWRAVFTGIDDVYSMRNYVNPGQHYSYNWCTLNAGFGIEKNWGHFGLFGELKLRINKQGLYPSISVIDIVYNLGIKYEFGIAFRRKEKLNESEMKSNEKIKSKRLFGTPSDRYHWF
ncbi:MAG: hypothetical protein IT235_01970 [Bacteroidia bacterium]|nr:hypothetical protein [Bacteroidia bacterium]